MLFSVTVNKKCKPFFAQRMLVLFMLLCMAWLAPQHLRAQSTNAPIISVTVTPDTLLTGDRATCTVTVRHAANHVATLLLSPRRSGQALDAAELVSQQRFLTENVQGSREERFVLEFALFRAGQQPLPPLGLTMRQRANNSVVGTYPLTVPSVFVRALTDSTMRELRPIKPPQPPSFPIMLIVPVLLAVFMVTGVGWLLFFVIHRVLGKQASNVDLGQVAQRKLRKLGSRLSSGMPPHECYDELSNIMRTFLEHHYRIRALEAVTQEIERDLKKLGVAGYETILSLLRQADLVKFADMRPNVEESRQSLNKAAEIIRATRTVRSPEEPKEVVGE